MKKVFLSHNSNFNSYNSKHFRINVEVKTYDFLDNSENPNKPHFLPFRHRSSCDLTMQFPTVKDHHRSNHRVDIGHLI